MLDQCCREVEGSFFGWNGLLQERTLIRRAEVANFGGAVARLLDAGQPLSRIRITSTRAHQNEARDEMFTTATIAELASAGGPDPVM
jgi:hypothetical protein